MLPWRVWKGVCAQCSAAGNACMARVCAPCNTGRFMMLSGWAYLQCRPVSRTVRLADIDAIQSQLVQARNLAQWGEGLYDALRQSELLQVCQPPAY